MSIVTKTSRIIGLGYLDAVTLKTKSRKICGETHQYQRESRVLGPKHESCEYRTPTLGPQLRKPHLLAMKVENRQVPTGGPPQTPRVFTLSWDSNNSIQQPG